MRPCENKKEWCFMINNVDFYYFSPTGGTKKAGAALALGLAKTVNEIDLAEKIVHTPSSDVVVVAVPVFAGRIPTIVVEKLAQLDGAGKKAITAVVYGVRAYEDALMELNDAMKNSGFDVVASAALIAQHSMVPAVGAGRPDQADIAEIQEFARGVLNAIKEGRTNAVIVPGNYPYKEGMKVSATPISLSSCGGCGYCVSVCPMDAIMVSDGCVVTDIKKCILCLTCTAKCPTKSRVLPTPLQEGIAQKLSPFKDVYRKNEFYISY